VQKKDFGKIIKQVKGGRKNNKNSDRKLWISRRSTR